MTGTHPYREDAMPNFTHKNLSDVKDSAPDFGFAENGELHFAKDELETEQTGFSYHRTNPNVHPGFGHRHQAAEEVYVVISGSGRMKLDDEIIEIERLDSIRIAPEVWRSFSAGPEGLEVLAFGPRHDNDGEADPQWWVE
jgi:mannose-6-phosphate isomerase-like protein (cupin superfamily)